MPKDSEAEIRRKIERRLRRLLSEVAQENPNGALILLNQRRKREWIRRLCEGPTFIDFVSSPKDRPTICDFGAGFDQNYIDGLRKSLEKKPNPVVQMLCDVACAAQPDSVDQFIDALQRFSRDDIQSVADHLNLKPAGRPRATLAGAKLADIEFWWRVNALVPSMSVEAACSKVASDTESKDETDMLRHRFKRFDENFGDALRSALQLCPPLSEDSPLNCPAMSPREIAARR